MEKKTLFILIFPHFQNRKNGTKATELSFNVHITLFGNTEFVKCSVMKFQFDLPENKVSEIILHSTFL
jgi:hypothetical protein